MTLSSLPRRSSLFAIGLAALLVGVVGALTLIAHLAADAQRNTVTPSTTAALLRRSALLRQVSARIGPGPATAVVSSHGYQLRLGLSPNRALQNNRLSLALSRNGRPLVGARVALIEYMIDMDMGQQLMGSLPQTARGVYGRRDFQLGMAGTWGLRLHVMPAHGKAFTVAVADTAMS